MTGNPSNGPTDAVVIAALEKTGFLLERDVHQAVQRAGLNSLIGPSYSDPDDGRTRELDVLGIAGRYEGKSGPVSPDGVRSSVFVHVLIECKRWTAPLVGIGGAVTDQDRRRVPMEYSISDDPYRFDRKPKRLDPNIWGLYHHLSLENLPHPCANADVLATQLVLMEQKSGSWSATNTSMWDGVVLPLAKAQGTYDLAAKDSSTRDSGSVVNPLDRFTISYRRCALVTTAPLITVNRQAGSDTVVSHPKWFPVARELSLPYFDGRFVFEVVGAEFVDEWLESLVLPHVDGIWGRVTEWASKIKTEIS